SPRASENIYIDGAAIVEHLIDKHKNHESKDKYIDTLMIVYDQRIRFFGKEGEILGRKGEALLRHRPENNDKLFDVFKRSVDLQGNASMPAILVYYFRSAEKMVRDEKLSKDKFFAIYEQIIGVVDFNSAQHHDNPKELANWENVRNFVEQTVEPYATCDDLVAIFTRKFNETPNDLELLYKIIKLFDRKGCTDKPLYLKATLRAYELDPSPQSAYGIGRMYYKNKEYSKAIEYLKEAEKLQNSSDKADGLLILAYSYKSLNNSFRARDAALKAIDARPGEGNAFILIGDLYAESAKDCGSNELSTGAVYWAAVDKYLQARAVDSSVADAANNRIGVYSKHFPSHETIFFYGLSEGEIYRVECWINENTTIRPAK
ncbi:MAG: hypothetical protein Q8M23_03335, partial [Bacteroidales bacterium]|nr:hypothetical protein [Bacteroidales bacterium]